MRVKNFMITGPPGSGKTTLLLEIMKNLKDKGFKIGGIMCPEVREKGRRVGFKIINVASGEEGILATKNFSLQGPRIGRYIVNISDLEGVGVKAIRDALEGEEDLIVIDEIGVMELLSEKFQKIVKEALDSEKPVLGIIHQKSNHRLLRHIRGRGDTKIYQLARMTPTEERLEIAREIISEVLNIANRDRPPQNTDKKM